MIVDTIKENLCVNKKIATKKEIIFVEGDVIVPDAKPDVINIICTSGVACIYKKDIIDENFRNYILISSYNLKSEIESIYEESIIKSQRFSIKKKYRLDN